MVQASVARSGLDPFPGVQLTKILWPLSALGLLFMSSSACAMTVADFLGRAEALKARGMMAMFSGGEIKALKAEVQGAANTYRVDARKALARGDTSLGCPPAKGSAKLAADELLKSLRAIPVERQKSISVKTGFYELMKSRYPCG
jgi:hypothetical protein